MFGVVVVFVLLFAAVGIHFLFASHAATPGDAAFSLSPSTGSYTVGATVTLNVSETSSSGDDVNATQANFSYPTSLLQYESITLNGPFTLCGQETGGGGTVDIGCASTTTVSGTQPIAQIIFKVLSDGTAPVAMTSGSDIDNNSGNSVWNTVLPSASYTLTQPTTPPPAPTPTPTPAPSPTKSTSSSSSSSTKSSSTPTTPTPVTTTPTTTTPTTILLTSLSVTITNTQGQPVVDAKVVLDKQTAYTNKNGIANFAGVPSGTYTMAVSDPGKKTTLSMVVLDPGENKLVSVKLANQNSVWTAVAYIAAGAVVIIIIGGGYGYVKYFQESQGGFTKPKGSSGGSTTKLFTPGSSTPITTTEEAVRIQKDPIKQKNHTIVNKKPDKPTATAPNEIKETVIHPTDTHDPED